MASYIKDVGLPSLNCLLHCVVLKFGRSLEENSWLLGVPSLWTGFLPHHRCPVKRIKQRVKWGIFQSLGGHSQRSMVLLKVLK